MEQRLKITNDIVFQRIFGKLGNERITKKFIERVLGVEIEELTLDTNKRLIGKLVDTKIGRLDVKAKFKDGTKVIIEMQVAMHKHLAERLLYYWAETYVEDLKQGQGYESLDKVVAILISVENLKGMDNIEKYHTKWQIREEENFYNKLTDDLEIHIIELNKFKDGQNEQIDNWIKFLKGANMSKVRNFDKEIEEAIKELNLLMDDPEMRDVYEQRQIDLRDKITMLNTGREEGKNQIIKAMYKNGMKIEEICKFTEMKENEIKKIIDEK